MKRILIALLTVLAVNLGYCDDKKDKWKFVQDDDAEIYVLRGSCHRAISKDDKMKKIGSSAISFMFTVTNKTVDITIMLFDLNSGSLKHTNYREPVYIQMFDIIDGKPKLVRLFKERIAPLPLSSEFYTACIMITEETLKYLVVSDIVQFKVNLRDNIYLVHRIDMNRQFKVKFNELVDAVNAKLKR